jgi:hypothetical protein
MKTEAPQLYDVVAVDISTGKVAALFGEGKTLRNAEAIVNMAVMRRGVEEQFYAEVLAGQFKVGDAYSS